MFVIGLEMNIDRFKVNTRDTTYWLYNTFIVGFIVFKLMGYSNTITYCCFSFNSDSRSNQWKLLLELDALYRYRYNYGYRGY